MICVFSSAIDFWRSANTDSNLLSSSSSCAILSSFSAIVALTASKSFDNLSISVLRAAIEALKSSIVASALARYSVCEVSASERLALYSATNSSFPSASAVSIASFVFATYSSCSLTLESRVACVSVKLSW